jgi:hypothetical protein
VSLVTELHVGLDENKPNIGLQSVENDAQLHEENVGELQCQSEDITPTDSVQSGDFKNENLCASSEVGLSIHYNDDDVVFANNTAVDYK